MNKKVIATLMLFLATLFWGLSYSIQMLSADNLGSFTIVFFKGFGGLFLLPFIIFGKRKIDRNTIIGGVIIGITVFIGCALQQIGMELSIVSKASFISALYIIVVPILETFSGKKIKSRLWLSIVVAIIGLYLLCFHGSLSLSIGDILLFLCSVVFAYQIIFIDKYSKKCDSISLTFVAQTTMSILSFIVMMFVEKPQLNDIKNAILPILFMVFVSGMIAQTIQMVYQKDVGPSLGSLIMSFESVFGAIGGWLILNQVLSVREIVGCILVFIAIVIAEN